MYDERIRIAVHGGIGTREHRPDGRADGTCRICPLCAEDGVFRIALVEEILRGKDVRMHIAAAHRAIGGELREKVVVIRFALCTREQLIEECGGSIVVLPKYAKIVCHVTVPSFVQSAPLLCKQLPVVRDPLQKRPCARIEERTQLCII